MTQNVPNVEAGADIAEELRDIEFDSFEIEDTRDMEGEAPTTVFCSCRTIFTL
jgi:hypothetical protein